MKYFNHLPMKMEPTVRTETSAIRNQTPGNCPKRSKLQFQEAPHFIAFNPLNAELNPICHLLALLGAHHILHVSRIRVKKGTQAKSDLERKWKEAVLT